MDSEAAKPEERAGGQTRAPGRRDAAVGGGSAAASEGERDAAGAGWVRGAALLGGAALASKLLGTLQKIPLQNIAGDRVFGIYSAVYPFYQLLLFVAAAGIPAAVSLLVAERAEAGDPGGARAVVAAANWMLGLTAAAALTAMWLTAGWTAAHIGDAAAAPAIRASALALCFAPFAASLRGYFQGRQRMGPSAASQIGEQAARVAAMLAALYVGWQAGWGDAALAAGASAGAAFGGMAGLAVLLLRWRREPKPAAAPPRRRKAGGGVVLRADMRRLAALAWPAALGSIAVPVAGIVDAFTVPRLLAAGGLPAAEAMTQFGLYSRGQPLVQLAAMLAAATGGALVPALAAAVRRGDRAAASRWTALAMRLSWALGLAAAGGLALLAGPVNVMLYADGAATDVFAVVCGAAWAGAVSATAAAVLQGLGRPRLPAALLLLAALLKAALNAALVPALGIAGAAWAGAAAFAAAALLAAAAVRRAAGAPAAPGLRRFAAGVALALACMAAALWLLRHGFAALPHALPPRAAATALALTGTAVGGAAFAAALLLGGAVSARELRALLPHRKGRER